MQSFERIFAVAAERKGGVAELEALLPAPETPGALKRIGDDRWLSEMSRCVFQAGFNWKVVEDKWPRFEEVFEGFDIGRWCLMSDDDLDRLLKTDGIVRHAKKLRSIGANAMFIRDLAAEHGSAANAFADWPTEDLAGLLWMIKKRGDRLGGRTGQVFLRRMGVDGYILSGDVLKALKREGVADREPTSKRALETVQEAFNRWRAESGRPLMQISRTLACSID
ncbi:MAG: DNA-3-methyladenine glycosylase I [Rhodospirillales bacterium]|nr:DNA-3-methyladenine glycosylase I [Rhodospirillales bacterium]